MTLKDLIGKLQELQHCYGDLEVKKVDSLYKDDPNFELQIVKKVLRIV